MSDEGRTEGRLSQRDLYQLKKLIKELDRKTAIDGHSTTLVSLIVPGGTPISEITELVRQELATAARIKSRTTRKHVQAALSSIQSRLRYWSKVPENGLIIYAGITQDGKLEYHEIVPPKPVRIKRYLCDSRFYTDVLKEMIKETDKYGVILVERDEATIGLLEGSRIEVVKELRGFVPPKHSKGGQSARRFERATEEAYKDFLKKVADEANRIFLEAGVKGIIVGGPGYAKEDLVNSGYLDYRLRKKIIGVVTTQYMGEEGLREALYEARELIREAQYIRERRAYDELMRTMMSNPELVASGFREVVRALQEGRVDKLLVLEGLEGKVVSIKCEGSDSDPVYVMVQDDSELHKVEERARKYCGRVGGTPQVEVVDEDVVDFLVEMAHKTGAAVEFISGEGETGAMFRNTFKGIAAILRYA